MDNSVANFSGEQGLRIGRAVQAVERAVQAGGSEAYPDLLGWFTPNPHFAVKCTKDGGSAGSDSTTCSWTYTVKALDGTVLGAAISPTKYRLPNHEYVDLPADSIGAAYFDETGTLRLWDAGEIPASEDCVSPPE